MGVPSSGLWNVAECSDVQPDTKLLFRLPNDFNQIQFLLFNSIFTKANHRYIFYHQSTDKQIYVYKLESRFKAAADFVPRGSRWNHSNFALSLPRGAKGERGSRRHVVATSGALPPDRDEPVNGDMIQIDVDAWRGAYFEVGRLSFYNKMFKRILKL